MIFIFQISEEVCFLKFGQMRHHKCFGPIVILNVHSNVRQLNNPRTTSYQKVKFIQAIFFRPDPSKKKKNPKNRAGIFEEGCTSDAPSQFKFWVRNTASLKQACLTQRLWRIFVTKQLLKSLYFFQFQISRRRMIKNVSK